MLTVTEEQKEKARERLRRWREKLPADKKEKIRQENCDRARKAYHENQEVKERQQRNFKKNYDSNPEFRKDIVRRASLGRYKMSPKEYDKQLAEQGGHCALCSSVDGDAGRRLHVDHDHNCCNVGSTGRTCGKCNRGLLCGPCNRRLATVEDLLTMGSIIPRAGTWLENAKFYLMKYGGWEI